MVTGTSGIKATTIEEQSEQVLRIAQGILSEFDRFLGQDKVEKELKGTPPKLDPIAQIGDNLCQTETYLNQISEQLSRLKARIRA